MPILYTLILKLYWQLFLNQVKSHMR